VTRIAALLIAGLLTGSHALARDFIVSVSVDATKAPCNLPPIWRFFGADEPNYATTADGEQLLTELGALRPRQIYFRAHNMMTTGDGTPDFKWGSTNLYREVEGRPVDDFTIADHIIDTYLARGIHPYLELGFMPEAMTAAPTGVPYRRPWKPGVDYRGLTAGWSYPPQDYRKWAELVYRWTVHNVERYGRAEVESWYFEVWNEANLDFYWQGNAEEFFRLHDYAVDAVRRALPQARVGGPDVAGSGGTFMDGFLNHITAGTNYATGKVGTPTDFLSFHAKGRPTIVDGHVRMGISEQLKTVDEAFAKISAITALAHKAIIIGENDPEGCAACPGPQNDYRNGTLYSSYTAALYPRLWDLANRRHVNLEGALTWAFTFAGQPWFAGYRQLATNGVDLPVINAFRLLSRLGPERLDAASSAEVPLDQVLKEGVRAPEVGVLATRELDGRVKILLWHYRDDNVPGASADIRLIVGRVAPNLTRARVWRVDRQHGDSYSEWVAMGRPPHPSEQQVTRLARAAEIHGEPLQLERRHDGSTALELRLPLQGVDLIELD
jgi:xylan 1,4-beta-xylosidase